MRSVLLCLVALLALVGCIPSAKATDVAVVNGVPVVVSNVVGGVQVADLAFTNVAVSPFAVRSFAFSPFASRTVVVQRSPVVVQRNVVVQHSAFQRVRVRSFGGSSARVLIVR